MTATEKTQPISWFTILKTFQNQDYRFTIPKSRIRLAGKLEEEHGNCKALCVSLKHNYQNSVECFL